MIFFNNDGYQLISNPNKNVLKKTYSDVWKDETFPEKQWRRVEKQLKQVDDIPEFVVIIDCIRTTGLKNPSILDVGCSSGYLSEVLKIKKINANYEGTHYSPSFINFAREKYPRESFNVNNATDLKYKNKSFDIVISACCLLHIIDYKKVISEAARVAKKFVIFHRTPVFHLQPTTFFTKTAYGAKMLEIVFNEEELVDIFCKNNLAITKIRTISSGNITIKNYLCKKYEI